MTPRDGYTCEWVECLHAGNPDWVEPTPAPTAYPLSFSFGYGSESERRALVEEAAFETELASSPEEDEAPDNEL